MRHSRRWPPRRHTLATANSLDAVVAVAILGASVAVSTPLCFDADFNLLVGLLHPCVVVAGLGTYVTSITVYHFLGLLTIARATSRIIVIARLTGRDLAVAVAAADDDDPCDAVTAVHDPTEQELNEDSKSRLVFPRNENNFCPLQHKNKTSNRKIIKKL